MTTNNTKNDALDNQQWEELGFKKTPEGYAKTEIVVAKSTIETKGYASINSQGSVISYGASFEKCKENARVAIESNNDLSGLPESQLMYKELTSDEISKVMETVRIVKLATEVAEFDGDCRMPQTVIFEGVLRFMPAYYTTN